MIHLTRWVAKELARATAGSNCICPGGIATPIFGKALDLATQVADQTIEPLKKALAKFQPIPRAGVRALAR